MLGRDLVIVQIVINEKFTIKHRQHTSPAGHDAGIACVTLAVRRLNPAVGLYPSP